MHFYESVLIDTVDGLHCKTYSNEHPEGYVIVKPKYIPKSLLNGENLKYRFLFEKAMIRFNLFAQKEKITKVVDEFKKKFPDYIYACPKTKNWFFAIPKSKIKTIHDPKQGIQELMQIPEKDLDEYLRLVRELIEFLLGSGIKLENLGITHSTLMGKYTFGKSDIDLLVFGKENGWKVLEFLKNAKHEKLHWKTDAEWAEYYKDHKTSESSHFTEEEYVKHMRRKRYEGMFGGTVFTLFTVEEPNETWFKWENQICEPIGTATIKGIVADNYNSNVRPGFYGVENAEIIDTDGKNYNIDRNLKIKIIVNYSIPFSQQALKGEKIKACGLLELVTEKSGEKYYRIVVGYFDAYLNDRREKEYIKAEI